MLRISSVQGFTVFLKTLSLSASFTSAARIRLNTASDMIVLLKQRRFNMQHVSQTVY
jgi:hypothetical protein